MVVIISPISELYRLRLREPRRGRRLHGFAWDAGPQLSTGKSILPTPHVPWKIILHPKLQNRHLKQRRLLTGSFGELFQHEPLLQL